MKCYERTTRDGVECLVSWYVVERQFVPALRCIREGVSGIK